MVPKAYWWPYILLDLSCLAFSLFFVFAFFFVGALYIPNPWLLRLRQLVLPHPLRFAVLNSLMSGFGISVGVLLFGYLQKKRLDYEHFWQLLLAVRKEGEANRRAVREFYENPEVKRVVNELTSGIKKDEINMLWAKLKYLAGAMSFTAWDLFKAEFPKTLRRKQFYAHAADILDGIDEGTQVLENLLFEAKKAEIHLSRRQYQNVTITLPYIEDALTRSDVYVSSDG